MHTILKSAVALGALALAAAAVAQEGAPPPGPPQGQGTAPPRQGPPRRAPQPYKPSPAVTASFGDRNPNFTGVVDPDAGQLCYLLNVAGIDGATSARIEMGTPGKAQTVVNLQPPAAGSSGTCAQIGGDTARALLDHADKYFIEIDSAAYPQGAAYAPLKSETYS